MSRMDEQQPSVVIHGEYRMVLMVRYLTPDGIEVMRVATVPEITAVLAQMTAPAPVAPEAPAEEPAPESSDVVVGQFGAN